VARPILFLTDYGLADEFVGLCHAVIARLAPQVRVIDLAHGIPPGDVLGGAVTLASAVPHAPQDAVFLAVVDPGVGTERRAVALEAGRGALVGPDNGVLAMAADVLGGVDRAVEMDPARVAPGPVSATFHGRDVFAPAAAMIASGGRLEELGSEVDPSSLTRVAIDEPIASAGRLETIALGVDRFGNVRLAARPADLATSGLGDRFRVTLRGTRRPVRVVRTFADLGPDEVGLLEDSAGWLALVRNGSSAAETFGCVPYDRVMLDRQGGAVG
jgi:S-adenosyl-L-methionine hydrolase (adenosine-forming)